jgi:ketosteroid isomerase-like protein
MGAAENKQLIQNMFAELSKGNANAFLASMADDVRFTLIGTTKYSGVFNGKQELINKLLAPLTAQLEGGIALTPDNFIAEGEYVAMQARGKANTKSGKSYNNTYCQVFRIVNGKVQEVTEYLDTELVTSAFGK